MRDVVLTAHDVSKCAVSKLPREGTRASVSDDERLQLTVTVSIISSSSDVMNTTMNDDSDDGAGSIK